MATTPIIAHNQTASVVTIADIGVDVPANGLAVLTDFLFTYEIHASADLTNAIALNLILLDLGAGIVTKSESLNASEPPVISIPLDGLVSGSGGSLDSSIVLFNGIDGYNLKDSTITVDGYGNMASVGTIDGINLQSHSTRHIPGGLDALATASPVNGIGSGNFEGIASSFARSDHDHTIRESGGVELTTGSILDGEFIKREASALVSVNHEALRKLIHFINDGPGEGFASGSFKETLPIGDPFPLSFIWYESPSKLKKIVEFTVTRAANKIPTVEEWIMYDIDGSTILVTVTDNIVYSNGIFEQSRTRTIV